MLVVVVIGLLARRDVFLVLFLGRCHGGCKFGLLAEFLAEEVETDGDGDAEGGKTA